MKIFVLDFSKENNLIVFCSQNNHNVTYEQHDGGRAYQKVKEIMPDILVVNYQSKPSHGRVTAQKIYQRKSTSEIPIYFVNGSPENNQKIHHFGIPVSQSELENIL